VAGSIEEFERRVCEHAVRGRGEDFPEGFDSRLLESEERALNLFLGGWDAPTVKDANRGACDSGTHAWTTTLGDELTQ
jgi:hypothetical protein